MTFTLTDAAEIALAPFITIEEHREEARQRYHEADARRSSGACWSGMGPAPQAPRSEAEVRAAALVAYERANAFAASPRGQFLLAVRQLENFGWVAEVELARAAFSRGFASSDHPASPREIGVALRAIEPIDHPQARAACLALTELLVGELKVAAE